MMFDISVAIHSPVFLFPHASTLPSNILPSRHTVMKLMRGWFLTLDQPSEQMVAPYVARERHLFSICCSTRLTSSSSNLVRKILYPRGVYANRAKEVICTTSINSSDLTPLNAQLLVKNIMPTTCPNWITTTLQGPPWCQLFSRAFDWMVAWDYLQFVHGDPVMIETTRILPQQYVHSRLSHRAWQF